MKKLALFFATIFIFWSCQKHTSQNCEFEKGKIILVSAKSDSTIKYFLYLPEDFKSDGKFPVIIGLDAHKDGKHFVKTLQYAADLLGVVVAGSANFENGVKNGSYIVETVYKDIIQRLNINKNAIFIGGFSGGARFAQIMGFTQPYFKGILSLSAGFSLNQQPTNKIPAAFVFGTKDFNYFERFQTAQIMQNLNLPFAIFEFDGIHQYPDDTTAFEALAFLYAKAMQNNWLENYGKKIKTIKQHYLNKCKNLNLLAKYYCLQNAVITLDGLTNVEKFSEDLQEIIKSEQFEKSQQRLTSVLDFEQKIIRQYQKIYFQKDTAWWEREIKNLYKFLQKENDPVRLASYYRIKAFLGILSYEFAKNSAFENDSEKLRHTLFIYGKLEPQNPDYQFFTAVYFKMNGQTDSAKFYLNKAVKNNFDTTQVIYEQLWK